MPVNVCLLSKHVNTKYLPSRMLMSFAIWLVVLMLAFSEASFWPTATIFVNFAADDSVAEWSKALDLKSSGFARAGSNPATVGNIFFLFYWIFPLTTTIIHLHAPSQPLMKSMYPKTLPSRDWMVLWWRLSTFVSGDTSCWDLLLLPQLSPLLLNLPFFALLVSRAQAYPFCTLHFKWSRCCLAVERSRSRAA